MVEAGRIAQKIKTERNIMGLGKFRAWDEEVKKMYYLPNRHLYLTMGGVVLNMQSGAHLKPLFFTGRQDGTETDIFDGDIVSGAWHFPMNSDPILFNGIAEWNSGCFEYVWPERKHDSDKASTYCFEYSRDIVILGNRFEDPELMELLK